MFKRMTALLLVLALTVCLVGAALAVSVDNTAENKVEDAVAAETEAVTAAETQAEAPSSNFYLNGKPVYSAGVYFVNGVMYCSVRTFFESAVPGIKVSGTDGKIELSGTTAAGESISFTATAGDYYVSANGRCLYVAGKVANVSGIVMAPVSVMAAVFNGVVAWNAETSVGTVTLGEKLLTSGNQFYDAQSLDLLSRLINAEAGNQPIKGKIAVANVILNRVNNGRFPNTIYGVIYAANQFSVVNTGAIKRTPNASSVAAAKLALEGVSILPTALYFNSVGLNCWAARNRDYVATIGGHAFYA